MGTAVTSGVLAGAGAIRAVLDDDGDVVGVATRWAPRSLLVTPLAEAGARCLVDALGDVGCELPGVDGLAPGPVLFAQAWTARQGRKARQAMALGLHVLGGDEVVRAPHAVPGGLVRAGRADAELVTRWLLEFDVDAHPTGAGRSGPDAQARFAADALDAGQVWLWTIDGRPVATALNHPATGGVARVSGVYTPPELRGRGYAGACVAALTRQLLDGGATACALYTDLANPTSNGVYRRIGYRQIGEAESWLFD
jgi:ribosomal protein S18 acetylase RimI-like enzyme